MTNTEPQYTVNLRARDDAATLYYRVSVTDSSDKETAGFIHETENYNEALIYAKVFFDELHNSKVVVASYIEQPYRLMGQGALYSVGSFAEAGAIVSDKEFYTKLAEEFVDNSRQGKDINAIFRRIVTKHKLDLYKESKFINHLQQLKLIDSDDQSWIEEE